MEFKYVKLLKKGTQIRLAKNVSYSIKAHGGLSGLKKELAGTIQTVKYVDPSNKERIYIDSTRPTVSFNYRDVEIVDMDGVLEEENQYKSAQEPQLFDPDKLIL